MLREGYAPSLEIASAEARLPSTVVASVERYQASRILTIDRVPQRFDVQILQGRTAITRPLFV